jgi:hypothetical protein
MRLQNALVSVGLFSNAFFADGALIERSTQDVSVFKAAVANISNAIIAFDNSVNTISSPEDVPTAVIDLQSKTSAIVSVVNFGTTNVQNTASLSVADVLQLYSPISALGTTAQTCLNDLTGKHDNITSAGEDTAVVSMIVAIKSAMQPFENAVVSKVPLSLKSTAQSLADSIITALNNAAITFGGTGSMISG